MGYLFYIHLKCITNLIYLNDIFIYISNDSISYINEERLFKRFYNVQS